MIYSSTSIYALDRYGDSLYFLKRHIIFLLFGTVIAALAMAIDYRVLKKYSKPIILIALFLLVLVLIPGLGREVSGARRWFRFRFISFQPSELANLAIIIYAADFASRKFDSIKTSIFGSMPLLAVLGATVFLILLQPDLGTVLAMTAVVMIMLFIAGLKPVYIVNFILLSLPALYLLIFSVPYRRARIFAFLNPWADPRGSGFQIIQSQIALGSGGIFGAGLGHSKQKLFYLPAAHTDFVFSIIGEELGLIGTIIIIALFTALLRLSYLIIKNAPDRFGYFLSLGLTLMLALKTIVNIGVSCGIFPTKGLPLPFISYGGSSLIFDMVSIGLILNVARTGDYP